MNKITYYAIKLDLSGSAPNKLFCQQEKDELFLSANGVLVGRTKMAHLESRELAELFMEAYIPRLQKRYDADVNVEIRGWTSRGDDKRTMARIEADSVLARKRLETGILASNVKP